MIHWKNKDTTGIYWKNRAHTAMYKGLQLVWQAVKHVSAWFRTEGWFRSEPW
jgi:hypothetical protein